MDWLHAVDLGITADWLGSLFFYLQSEKIRGVSKLLRCAKLFTDIQECYNRVQATDRLPKLLPTMLRDEDKGKAKAPKLRAKAGEARALVPCALELARKYLDPVISQELISLSNWPGMMSILVRSGHIGTRAMDTPWRSWVGDEEANLACVLFLAKS